MAIASNKVAADFDVEKIRSQFPALDQKVHGHPLVYLDSGASSHKPDVVLEAIDHYYRNDHSNVHRGVHTLSERATVRYDASRVSIQKFLNAGSVSEIIYTSGTTEALNLVAQSWGRTNISAGDDLLVSEMEHHSNIVPWQMLAAEKSATVRKIPMNNDGVLDMDAYKVLLQGKPRVVAITHVANALGTVNPLAEIVRLAHDAGAIVVADGAQSTPHMPVDVQALDVDFYAFSGHKIYGPTGIGALYGKEALLEAMPPWQGGGDMIKSVTFDGTIYNDLPFKFEAGTPNIADAIGMGVAAEYLLDIGLDAVAAHEHSVLSYASSRAAERNEMTIYGNAPDKAGILSFALEGIHPHDIGTMLDHQGVAVRTGHHCAQPVMQFFGVPATTRASLGIYNNRQDIDRLFDGIDEVMKLFKR